MHVDKSAGGLGFELLSGYAHRARPLNRDLELGHRDGWPAQRDVFAGTHSSAERKLKHVQDLAFYAPREHSRDFLGAKWGGFEFNFERVGVQDFFHHHPVQGVVFNDLVDDGELDCASQRDEDLAD